MEDTCRMKVPKADKKIVEEHVHVERLQSNVSANKLSQIGVAEFHDHVKLIEIVLFVIGEDAIYLDYVLVP
jgi:hypothetical protein